MRRAKIKRVSSALAQIVRHILGMGFFFFIILFICVLKLKIIIVVARLSVCFCLKNLYRVFLKSLMGDFYATKLEIWNWGRRDFIWRWTIYDICFCFLPNTYSSCTYHDGVISTKDIENVHHKPQDIYKYTCYYFRRRYDRWDILHLISLDQKDTPVASKYMLTNTSLWILAHWISWRNSQLPWRSVDRRIIEYV